MKDALDLKSKSGVHRLISSLEERGFIRRLPNRARALEVIKLVGGTDSFVRRPFLYLGFWYGFGGAVIAFLLLQVSLLFLSGPVEMLAQSYRDDFVLLGPGGFGYLLLFVSGSLLGVLGAVIAVSRHLSEIEPQ